MPVSSPPVVQKETVGSQARRLAMNAQLSNEWCRPPIFGPVAWQPDTYFEEGRVIGVGGLQWISAVAGATSDSGPPTWSIPSNPTLRFGVR